LESEPRKFETAHARFLAQNHDAAEASVAAEATLLFQCVLLSGSSMAPKAKGKAAPKETPEAPAPKGKAKAAPKKRPLPEEPSLDEDRHRLQKQLSASFKYVPRNETPEESARRLAALKEYQTANKEQRHNALALYCSDKINWQGQWLKSLEEKRVVTSNQVEGWMSPFEIMELKKVPKEHPRYDELWTSLRCTLVERPHQEPAWADLGECQYWYCHHDHVQTSNSTSESTAQAGKAAGKGTPALLPASVPEIVILHPEWHELQARKDVLASGLKKMSPVLTEQNVMLVNLRVEHEEQMLFDEKFPEPAELTSLLNIHTDAKRFMESSEILVAKCERVGKENVRMINHLKTETDKCIDVATTHLEAWKILKKNIGNEAPKPEDTEEKEDGKDEEADASKAPRTKEEEEDLD
jgi:hypothetical protein